MDLLEGDAIGEGVAQHADVQIGVREPRHRLADRGDGAQGNLGVEVITELRDELRFDRVGGGEHLKVVCELGVLGDDNALAAVGVKLRPPRTPEDLLRTSSREGQSKRGEGQSKGAEEV